MLTFSISLCAKFDIKKPLSVTEQEWEMINDLRVDVVPRLT